MPLDPPRPNATLRNVLFARLALALVAALPALAYAEAPPPAPVLPDDPVLSELIAQSLAARPELRRAQELVRAERARVPRAGALPDPVLSLGIQNDGFERIQVGEMETSYYQIMLSQGLPWPGKRGLRTDVARLSADQAEAGVARVRLSTEADVRRAYLDLLLVRERLALLEALDGIWRKSSGIAQARYETGDGAQSDILRAQLELNRLKQRKCALEAQEHAVVQALNRLRARPADEPIPTTARVRDLELLSQPDPDAAVTDALARSPELAEARLAAARAEREVALARRERFPDLAVNAGIMPRGDLEPMWQAGISVGLPVWSGRKQGRAVEESEARSSAGRIGVEAIEATLRQRVAERRTALASLAETLRLYREGLLVQSRATAESTLAQYRAGRVTFASVLDANAGYISDEEGYLAVLAEAQRIAIAAGEVSLAPVGGSAAGGGMGGAAIPGAGGMGGGAGPSPGASPAAPGDAGSSSSMSTM